MLKHSTHKTQYHKPANIWSTWPEPVPTKIGWLNEFIKTPMAWVGFLQSSQRQKLSYTEM